MHTSKDLKRPSFDGLTPLTSAARNRRVRWKNGRERRKGSREKWKWRVWTDLIFKSQTNLHRDKRAAARHSVSCRDNVNPRVARGRIFNCCSRAAFRDYRRQVPTCGLVRFFQSSLKDTLIAPGYLSVESIRRDAGTSRILYILYDIGKVYLLLLYGDG